MVNNYFNNNEIMNGTAIPTEGTFNVGDIVVNVGPNAAEEPMWICVGAGTPGNWEVVGAGAEIGMENLKDDVKEAIEAAGNIDLSGYATKEELNELFQDVDSGKIIIADAIDDRNVTKDSTFAAMGEAIEGIHADREEDRQKLIEILQGSNMDLTGNESMDTLLDLIDTSNIDLSKVVQIDCSLNSSYMVKNDGTLWACGRNDYGQLGLGDTTNRNIFTQVEIDNVKYISCGGFHTFIIKNDGSIWSCGLNDTGQLGLGDTTNRNTFVQVTTNINNDVKQIACGYEIGSGGFTIIIKNDGSLWACGRNNEGQLGLGDTTNRNTFVQVTTNINNDVKQVACGSFHTVILKNDGSLWSCGYNGSGQLGLSSYTAQNTFTQVTTNINNDVKQITCGSDHTLILKNDGSVLGAGSSSSYQLDSGTDSKPSFTLIANDVKKLGELSTGSATTFIIKNDNSVWVRGHHYYGQAIVPGSPNAVRNFTEVEELSNDEIEQIVNSNHTIILKADGSVWTCGLNNHGQLGIGNTTDSGLKTINEIEALKTQIQTLNTEATTNRGNLATVLTDEGVELTGNETLADLIVKTDEEFDNIMSSMPKWNGIWADLLNPYPVSAIYLMGTSVIGDIVYFTGGGTYNQRNQYNYSYNTTTNTWTKLAYIPILISYTTSAAHSTNVYMFSGKNNTTTGSNSTYQYDTVSNTWTAKANVLTNVSESVSETIGDNIYLIGGANPSTDSSLNTNQCYNVLTNTWTSKATIPTAMNRHASVVKGNTIYIVGKGYTYAYNPDTNSWTTLAGCSVSHQYAGAGIIDNEIYVVGGMNSKTSVYIYNIDNNTWGTGTNGLPSGNDYTSAEAVNGVLYTFLTNSSKTYCLLNFR